MVQRIGWFDVFRERGAPTWYGENRTAVFVDTTTVAIVAVFGVLTLAFLIVLPGVRKQRWSSFCSILLTLIVGSVILVSLHHPCWHAGEVHVYSTYRAFSAQRLDAVLGVRVGLQFVNITLVGVDYSDDGSAHDGFAEGGTTAPAVSSPHQHGLQYNERFLFTEVKSMERELQDALQKGLPYPILRVIEYLSVDRAGFIWGRQYRVAGYYTYCILWLCVALWTLAVVTLCLVPAYFTRTVVALGATLLAADLCYAFYTPSNMLIRFPSRLAHSPTAEHEAHLKLHLAWGFWATLAAGFVCCVGGVLVRCLEAKSIYRFATFLQTDFDEVVVSSSRPPRRGAGTTGGDPGRDLLDVSNDAPSVCPSPGQSPALGAVRKCDVNALAATGSKLRPQSASTTIPSSPPVQELSTMETAVMRAFYRPPATFTFDDDDEEDVVTDEDADPFVSSAPSSARIPASISPTKASHGRYRVVPTPNCPPPTSSSHGRRQPDDGGIAVQSRAMTQPSENTVPVYLPIDNRVSQSSFASGTTASHRGTLHLYPN